MAHHSAPWPAIGGNRQGFLVHAGAVYNATIRAKSHRRRNMEPIIRAFLETLRKTQFLPADRLAEYQNSLLDLLVRHARMHVPFYRDSGRLDPLFRPDDSIDWDRWEDIPLLTRQEVQLNEARLKSDLLPPEHGRTATKTTSGSTGEPLTVIHSDLSGAIAWTTLLLRAFERNRIDPTRRMAFIGGEKVDINGPRHDPAWTPAFYHLGIQGERVDLSRTRPSDYLVDGVAAIRPNYLQVMPSNLQLMMAHKPRPLVELGLEAVITYGEYFNPRAKAEIAEQLGCPIFEMYAANECGLIASTCPHCGRFHVEAETIRVDVVADNGHTVAPLETGRVAITPLYNYAMPLIRYTLADVARRGADNACEITLPSLDEVLGRERAPFTFRGGITIRPSLPVNKLIKFLGASRFQVAQIADDRCEVRIVPGSLARADMQFEEVTRLIRESWWEGLQVDYKIVDSLPHTTKPSPYVCELPGKPGNASPESTNRGGPPS